MSSSIEKIKDLLSAQSNSSYKRYDSQHPFDIYLGVDHLGRKSLALIMRARQEKIVSTKTIATQYTQREDGSLMLSFGLEDEHLLDLFYKFCEDIIETTRDSKVEDGFSLVVERWSTWIKFFQKTALPLSESQILGLIGEVYFLQNVMLAEYGLDASLEAYIGTDMAHKDFSINDTWYEVKAIHNGVRAVKISSIQQLDSDKPGKLEIITFDQGTPNTDGNITINLIISEFRSNLERKWQLLFDEKMRKTGYVEDERYDEYNYQFVCIDEYIVSNGFPRILKKELPLGITKASYEIDISAIQQYKVNV